MMEPEKGYWIPQEGHELNPKDVGILTSIAWEYYSLEDYAKASEYAERLPKYLPDDESVKYIREKLENQKLPEAEQIVEFVKNNYLYYDKIANLKPLQMNSKPKAKLV